MLVEVIDQICGFIAFRRVVVDRFTFLAIGNLREFQAKNLCC